MNTVYLANFIFFHVILLSLTHQFVSCQFSIFTSLGSMFIDFIKEMPMINGGNFVIKYPRTIRSNLRKQNNFPTSMTFPCANSTSPGLGRSLVPPTSVHKLRPGDIDVIAAMGDSLVAGNGALEEWALGTMIEHRGMSWCAGGEGTWRQYLTLPNILKEFNPMLTGYSTGTGEFLSSNAKLNVAYPVAADADALRQAKILIKKMKQDPQIDIKRHWKMITVFFGANDICSAQCFNSENASPHSHVKKLAVALDYLQENLPRTFINLIPVIDISVSIRVKRTMMCRMLHTLFCPCFYRGGNEMEIVTELTRQYQKAEEELIASGRYNKKDDFTVVIQPFIKLFNAPLDPSRIHDEVIDISYISHDCFHFSQKGHALGANMLWNNLLQPVGTKNLQLMKSIMNPFQCPTIESPYLFTSKNSKTFFETGHQ